MQGRNVGIVRTLRRSGKTAGSLLFAKGISTWMHPERKRMTRCDICGSDPQECPLEICAPCALLITTARVSTVGVEALVNVHDMMAKIEKSSGGRFVMYMMHPVSPSPGETVEANIQRALRWLAWLRKKYPCITFIAPWIAAIQSIGVDGTPGQREAGLVDDCAVVEICYANVAVGGRWSSGMRREASHASHIFDLTPLGPEPPAE